MTATTTGPTPEETREHLQARKALQEAELQEKAVLRGDARLALLRAVGIGPATPETIVDLRAAFNALDVEVSERTGALEILDAEIAALAPVVDQREAERLTERAAELERDYWQAKEVLADRIIAFARDVYGPAMAALRQERMTAVTAIMEARRAQKLPNREINSAHFDVPVPAFGYHGQLSGALGAIANTPTVEPHGVAHSTPGDGDAAL